ncbi:cell wall-associated NlpC family hydrolase [Actinomadura pelletieri DSM 43383]|uniref:Cell wall-associated NlpC family hydrolase n=1 Tax=Actinomadura pelletieri DSM 43383 TaxID=1120940 RepID=A0A495QAE2_9ACTN|nr:bifunctional lytic transglycosylase/C40 family peptidase [Actinomadura pelletieri]RKS68301.1 cell wall-associated NlpC family hydrolase [Actinomadura pelletieri DSM 43383]
MPVIALIIAVVLLAVVFIGAITSLAPTSDACAPQAMGPPVAGIPANYLALYRKAAADYGIPWEILAAIGSVESDHGRSTAPGVRSGANHAGAGGPMQFLPATWTAFGVDGNHDGRKDRYDPADAIPAAANYLRHNGAPTKMRTALFAYNHSNTYVDNVLSRAHKYKTTPTTNTPTETSPPAECAEAAAITAPNETIAKIIAFAMAQRGKPYVFGATGPNAWDCSSLVQAAYKAAGITIPRTTFTQWPFGVRVPNNQAQPGDLVFFNSGPGTSTNRPGHVGLVIGHGRMIAARCSTCRPAIGVEPYNRPDWTGTTRPLLRISQGHNNHT